MAQRTSRRAGADGRSDDVGPADSCPVVGVGASAGGIGALQKLLANIKPDSGGAFVVVQHLDPDRASSLAEILARSSRIPVATAEDGSGIAPNRVYVIPPDAVLTIEDGRLTLVKPDQPRGRRTPIDQFLVSLAEDCGPNSACIILSGTGSDGTLGLRAIKEHGG